MCAPATSLANTEIVNSLTGLATVVIAIFTIVYAWTTRSQLKVMSSQLSEMENQRKLNSQPVVVIKDITPRFEKPAAYLTPSANTPIFLSRFFLKFEMTNIGNTPIVGGKVITELYKNKSDGSSLLNSTFKEISYIEVGNQHKSSFLFSDSTDLLEHVIEVEHLLNQKDCKVTVDANKKMPYVVIKIAYKNITGAYFTTESKLRLAGFHESTLNAEEWYNSLKLAPITYQREIIEHSAQLKTDKNAATTTFDNIKKMLEGSLKYTDDLKLEVITDDVNFKIIDEDTYNKFGAR